MQFNCAYTELVSVSKLVPNPKNANKHSTEQIERLAKIIDFQGQRSPIVVSKRSGFITKGHGRLMAMQKLGWENVAVDYQDYLSEAQEYADVIADNEIARWAELDREMLNIELKNLDIDLDLLGILDFKIEPLVEVLVPQTDEDEVPEVIHPITRRGDVWLLENHRLMCGDSTMIDDVEKLMNGIYPDLIHTDPPYGMNAVTKSGVLSANYKIDIMGDDNPDVAKDSFLLIAGLYPNAKQVWWGANYYSSALPDSECWIVWDKNNGQSDQTDCELAWTNFRSAVRQYTQASEKTNRVHPTQKPISLTEWVIERFKLNPKSIADFFGGSGSTLIAAEKLKIPSSVMEFDPRFTDVIINRWQNYTGKKATLELTGQTYEELKVERENVG